MMVPVIAPATTTTIRTMRRIFLTLIPAFSWAARFYERVRLLMTRKVSYAGASGLVPPTAQNAAKCGISAGAVRRFLDIKIIPATCYPNPCLPVKRRYRISTYPDCVFGTGVRPHALVFIDVPGFDFAALRRRVGSALANPCNHTCRPATDPHRWKRG